MNKKNRNKELVIIAVITALVILGAIGFSKYLVYQMTKPSDCPPQKVTWADDNYEIDTYDSHGLTAQII